MHRVVWKRIALDQLAAIWVKATDQNAVTVASHAVDQALATDPANQGESRPHHQRVMFQSPLGVRFRINEKTRTVRVLACWQIRQV
jgi:hypothetical protein